MKHLTSSPSPETKLRKPWWSLSSSCWHYVTAHTQLHARCGKDQGTPRNSATMGPAPSPLRDTLPSQGCASTGMAAGQLDADARRVWFCCSAEWDQTRIPENSGRFGKVSPRSHTKTN